MEKKENISNERERRTLTQSKIKKLLDVEHIEELFLLLNVLKYEEIKDFIEHYNNSETKDKELSAIIEKSKAPELLINNIRDRLALEFTNKYESLKEEITENRKKGKDASLADITLMSAPYKILLFKTTESKKEFFKIKKILVDAENEIKKIV